MRDFKKIIAWQKAHALAVRLNVDLNVTRFRIRPSLRSQLLRAIDSVAANIAEGAGKPSGAEFGRYLDMALASARETENHLLLARDIGCLESTVAEELLDKLDGVKRVLYSYARAVRPTAARGGRDQPQSFRGQPQLQHSEVRRTWSRDPERHHTESWSCR